MTVSDMKRILKLLGPAGAAASLRASGIERDELFSLAEKIQPRDEKRYLNRGAKRDDIIDSIIDAMSSIDLKSTDELLKMSYDNLIQYFTAAAPSNEALLRIMKELNYKVGSEDKRNLRRFVARQISETALFSSVASRNQNDDNT